MLLLVLTLPALALQDVVVDIVPASPAVRCQITAFGGVPLAQPVEVGGASASVRLTLAELPAGVAPTAKGCWTPELHISTDHVSLEVWPAATVVGGLAFEKKGETPKAITASFVDASGDRGREKATCNIEDGVWRCVVPAGRPLHLQVAIDDFAPLFVWDVNLAPDAVYDSGIHTLVRGAAVAGRAVLDRGTPAANARVRIVPLTAGHQAPADRAVKARETRANASGHFQLAGLEPGTYRVTSAFEGRGDAVVESLELRAGEHLQLAEPLVHAELAELVVSLTPPVSSAQTPWTVELLRTSERDMEIVSVVKSAASVDGSWSRAGLQPMAYELRVIGPHGSHVVTRDVVLHGGREQIAIDVSAIAVTGRVVAGGEGVAAELTFDNNERRTVKATADESGAFTAEFPVAGTWRVRAALGRTRLRLEPVEISDPHPDELIVRIPGGGVEGKVFDPNGKPAANVAVMLKGPGLMPSTQSDEEGKFRLVGVDAGAYTIEAEAREDLGAGPLPVTIATDDVTSIDLHLESWKEVTGVVTTASGSPASGAVVRNFDPLTGLLEDTFADARGAFSFRVKPRSPVIDMIVLSPPAPVAMRRIAIGGKRAVTANVQLSAAGANLRLYIPQSPPWPVLTGPDGTARSLGLLLMPLFERRMWRELVDGGFNFLLEPGPYRICYEGVPCRDVQLAAHAETIVNLAAQAASNTN